LLSTFLETGETTQSVRRAAFNSRRAFLLSFSLGIKRVDMQSRPFNQLEKTSSGAVLVPERKL